MHDMISKKGVSQLMDLSLLHTLGAKRIECNKTGYLLHRRGRHGDIKVQIHKVIDEIEPGTIDSILQSNTVQGIGTLFLIAGRSQEYKSMYGQFRAGKVKNEFLEMADAEKRIWEKSGQLYHFSPREGNIINTRYEAQVRRPYEFIVKDLRMKSSENPWARGQKRTGDMDLFVRTQVLYESMPQIAGMRPGQVRELASHGGLGALAPDEHEMELFSKYVKMIDMKERTRMVKQTKAFHAYEMRQMGKKGLTANNYSCNGAIHGAFEPCDWKTRVRVDSCLF
jgi:hypothetical protein